MSVTLDATVGGTVSNSYVDLDTAETYFEGRPFSSAWKAASSSSKEQALVYATTLLDRERWAGAKGTSVTVAQTQALAWPRRWALTLEADADPEYVSEYFIDTTLGYYSDLTIPKPIKNATCELALAILGSGTSDPFSLDTTRNIKQEVVGPLSTTYFDPGQQASGIGLYPNVVALIAPLLRQSGYTRMIERV